LLGPLLFNRDPELLAQIHRPVFAGWESTQRLAHFLSAWGDYLTYNVPFAFLLWFLGVWTKNQSLRRLALICFLGATLAGLADDCFRFTLGRPRPDAHLHDGFYGVPASFQSHFQSYPSGHAAAVFGAAISLFVTDLPLGLLTGVYALLVVWSRLELNRHYPSDVLVGSFIGGWVGLLVGLSAQTSWPTDRLRQHSEPTDLFSTKADSKDYSSPSD
jgi:membrane-associated phospholipid phosphatase